LHRPRQHNLTVSEVAACVIIQLSDFSYAILIHGLTPVLA
jgi:hypothetical protein